MSDHDFVNPEPIPTKKSNRPILEESRKTPDITTRVKEVTDPADAVLERTLEKTQEVKKSFQILRRRLSPPQGIPAVTKR